jgi:protein-tyrosine phosphatase
MTIANHPIPNSYWVQPGQLLAGEYPRTPTEASSRAKLRQLLAAGVTCFLDLTEAGEYNLEPYAALAQAVAAEMGQPVEHRRMSIPDMTAPSPNYLRQILDAIEGLLAAGQVVYVHCFGGIGRTGTVAGCHMVRRGLSGEAALAEIARLRHGTPDGWRESPETAAQRAMVKSWPAGG